MFFRTRLIYGLVLCEILLVLQSVLFSACIYCSLSDDSFLYFHTRIACVSQLTEVVLMCKATAGPASPYNLPVFVALTDHSYTA